jgi:hypothetical protein
MKKALIFAIVLMAFLSASAQHSKLLDKTQFGLRFAPLLSFTKVDAESYAYPDAKSTGTGIRWSAGIIADYQLLKKLLPVYLSTGIWYSTRAANAIPGENYNGLYSKGRYNLSYVQIPLSAKILLYKINRTTWFYVQPGITFDIKVSEKPRDADYNYFYLLTTGFTQESLGKNVYKNFNLGSYLGAGIEKTLDGNTKIFGSISWSAGSLQILNNIQDKKDNGELVYVNKDLRVRTAQLAFEVGIKF